jgi:hypothetical protein
LEMPMSSPQMTRMFGFPFGISAPIFNLRLRRSVGAQRGWNRAFGQRIRLNASGAEPSLGAPW